MSDLPRKMNDGLFGIMLRPCTAEILRHLLDPEVPYVWVVSHYPNPYAQWWRCHLPLSKSSPETVVEVRSLCFDLLMPTSEFLTRLSDFDSLVLYQMNRRVPDTLITERLDDQNRVRILIENGLVASFYLPHSMECASFQTVERAAIEKVLANEAIQALAY